MEINDPACSELRSPLTQSAFALTEETIMQPISSVQIRRVLIVGAALASLSATPLLAKDVMVDGAPMSDGKTIAENAPNAKNLTTLVAAVKAAGLVETLNGPGPYTVFAPTNAAFDALPKGTVEKLLKPENKEMLKKVLLYHVVAANATAAAATKMVKDDGGSHMAKTAEGESLTLKTKGAWLTVTDASGNTANVIQADVIQKNGVVHIIDKVLMPKM
jgi:uncharacterized surface protein with fasciclin (FAS1) repeats